MLMIFIPYTCFCVLPVCVVAVADAVVAIVPCSGWLLTAACHTAGYGQVDHPLRRVRIYADVSCRYLAGLVAVTHRYYL